MELTSLDLKIWRGDAKGGDLVSYRVPVREGMVVLDAVLWVQANMASDLAVRWNCKAAKCGSCSAEIDGFPRLMCKTPIDEYGGRLSVGPMKAFPVIKDLVTDVSWNYQVNKEIPPFTPSDKDLSSSEPWRMQQKDVERVMEFRKCIECFLCQDVCHVLRAHDLKGAFQGPRAMVRIASLEMHPKDVLDRRPLLKGKAGIGYCNVSKCCTEVCPEHIHITDNAIIPLKERMDDVYFDPVRSLVNRLGGRSRKRPAD
jgi:succinate dehydrogenase / fumarate reductase iron-sulfur subunit